MQLTIDYLLKPNDEKPDNNFCLKWIQRDEPEEPPYFSKGKIDQVNFSYGFVNKLIHLPIMLSGNIKKRKDQLLIELTSTEEVPIYTNIHFLKSHLQKCVRLKKTALAIQTAKHLIDLDPVQFLRRLSIIFAEDAFITQHYSTLVWLMIAVSGKFTLQLHHIEWLLGLVHIACQSKYRENFELTPDLEELSKEKLSKQIIEMSKSIKDKYQLAVIHSLLIRSAFGGMHGDTQMLVNLAYIWTNRFIKNEGPWKECYYTPMRTISASVLPLLKTEWVLSAIDYHCFPKMLQWIQESEEIDENELKSLIWHFSSKINYRQYLENPPPNYIPSDLEKESWKTLQKQVRSIAKYAIKNYS